MLTTRPFVYTFACFTAVVFAPMKSARAWGDEGHETIALIAEHYLTPAAKAQVDALLAADTLNTLTEHDIASEATWPDKYREHGGAAKTSLWHYADIEVSTGDVAAACFKFPKLSEGQLASDGPAKDCVIDKIDEFEAELVNAATPRRRRQRRCRLLNTSCILLAMCISPSIRRMKTTAAATTS